MKKLEVGTMVNYCQGKSGKEYKIIRNEIIGKKMAELFAKLGDFDYILGEYNEKKEFIKHVTCKEGEIEKKD